MIQANVGGDDIPRGKGSRADEMAAFDQLPPAVRAEMRDMAINWNPSAALAISRAYGADTALAVLQKQEADMQGAYRARIGVAR